jgi:rhamnulokinase
MQPLGPPGTVLGRLTPAVGAQTGLGPAPVVAVAGHDTASAVAAVPAEGRGWAYLSSGTWSLMGIESPTPIIGPAALAGGLTNEAGLGGRWRVQKNIMGLWLLQECGRAWSRERAYTYDELVALAASAPPLRIVIDPDHPSFLNPPDMPAAIAAFCRAHGEPVPATVAEAVRCVFESLALAYRRTLDRLRAVSPAPIDRLHVIGGGVRNALLCQLTADATGLPVLAGPVEATAVGNLLTQALALGDLVSLEALRTVVRASFPVLRYEPRGDGADWDAAYARFLALVGEGG